MHSRLLRPFAAVSGPLASGVRDGEFQRRYRLRSLAFGRCFPESMMSFRSSVLVAALGVASPLFAQLRADLLVPPVTPLGASYVSAHSGLPGAPFAQLWSFGGARLEIAGETLWLDPMQGLTVLDAGTMPASGLRQLRLSVPGQSALHGLGIHAQVALFGTAAPNGVFTLSAPRTTVLSSATSYVGERFGDPFAAGLTGDFDAQVRTHLAGAPVQYSERRVFDAMQQGRAFAGPVEGPFSAHGARVQMLLRPEDMQACYDKALVGLLWQPANGRVLGSATFPRFRLELRHSDVRPDYTVDMFSQLPKYPDSGLDEVYTNNYPPQSSAKAVFDRAYTVDVNQQRQDGYVRFPAFDEAFVLDGRRSLLLEFFVPPAPQTVVQTGMSVWLPVITYWKPLARIYATGTAQQPIDPFTRYSGRGDNSIPDFVLQLASVRSTAISRFYDAPSGLRDWHTPLLTKSCPPGTEVQVECEGASGPAGTGTRTGWIAAGDAEQALDGQQSVRFRLTLLANGVTGAVPVVHSVILPVD